MAPRKSSQRRSAGATRAATAGITISSLAGTWAFKFSGYAMSQVRPWWLTGLGKFTIRPNGTLSGRQRSAITPIQGQDTVLATAAWTLLGKITMFGNDGTGDAKIVFHKIAKTPLAATRLQGEFFLLAPDVDHLWLISSGAKFLYRMAKDEPALESVQFEAVRSQVK